MIALGVAVTADILRWRIRRTIRGALARPAAGALDVRQRFGGQLWICFGRDTEPVIQAPYICGRVVFDGFNFGHIGGTPVFACPRIFWTGHAAEHMVAEK
ncbi:hypothetical protein NJBCHELONAE_43510 [Mycobacteroides chelonae]|nr:hypothetical protein NJBCHELONAE_43510 [Mycobacteroides chelonae]